MQSTYSFFPPSVHSAVTTLSRVAYQPEPREEEKQQHLCLTERERDCYRNVTHCHLQASQIGRRAGKGMHTQTCRGKRFRTREQRKRADEPAESEANLSNLIRKLIIENKLHS